MDNHNGNFDTDGLGFTFERMPRSEVEELTKTPEPSERTKMRTLFQHLVKSVPPGEGGRIHLGDANRATIRNRLKSAAKDVGVDIQFLRTRDKQLLRFIVVDDEDRTNGDDTDDGTE